MNASVDSRASKLAALLAARVVPVLRYTDASAAAYAAEVAVAAGCTTLELTWTIPGVTDLLRALRDKHGDTLLLGVGTVLDESQAREALVAGADFLVSPALATEAVDMAHAAGALCLLGAFTPTEVLAARRGRGYGEDLPRRHRWPQAPGRAQVGLPGHGVLPHGRRDGGQHGRLFRRRGQHRRHRQQSL